MQRLGLTQSRDSCAIPACQFSQRFSLKNALLSRLKAEKNREMRDVDDIRHGLADLRQTVIGSIEVLDEGHSKAIRVFTLVTLFFLPL